jgi:hypothetical protein
MRLEVLLNKRKISVWCFSPASESFKPCSKGINRCKAVTETLNKHPSALLWAGAYFVDAPLLGCYPTLSMLMAYCCSSNHSQGLFFHLVLLS